MIYRFISEITYTGFLRQELMLETWYYATITRMTIATTRKTNVLFPWTNSDVYIAQGLGFTLLDEYYNLIEDWNYVEMNLNEIARDMLSMQDWLKRGMTTRRK